jgi:hypothetical protein
MAPDFTLRIHVRLADSEGLGFEAASVDLTPGPNPHLILSAGNPDMAISSSQDLIFRASGYPSAEAAQLEGEHYLDHIRLSLASTNLGADIGTSGPMSAFFAPGLEMIGQQVGKEALNDQLGLMVFETSSNFVFATPPKVTFRVTRSPQRFMTAFSTYSSRPRVLTTQERLAFDLFSAASFQSSPEARFLLLFIAIEAMLEPRERPSPAIDYVNAFISTIKGAQDLAPSDRMSLLGALSWFRYESIRRTGRALAIDSLGTATYSDVAPDVFFEMACNLRNRLVHGIPPLPTRKEIGDLIEPLATSVADLLTAPDRKAAA